MNLLLFGLSAITGYLVANIIDTHKIWVVYQKGWATKKSDNPNSSIKRAQEHAASQHHMDPLDTHKSSIYVFINIQLTKCY
jgi:hypothetical protein